MPSDKVDSLAAPDAVAGEKNDDVENWASKEDSPAYDSAKRYYKTVQKAFDNKEDQDDRILEYWNIYNAIPDDNLQYAGNSTGYIPAVRDAINARSKRTLKQLFPNQYKHVEGISSDKTTPFTQLSLLEHYIRNTNLASIIRSDLVAGDVTGQWNLMVDWTKSTRRITKIVKRNPIIQQIDGEDISDLEVADPTDENEEKEEEDIEDEGPEIVDFATEDIAVIPPTCTDLQKADAVCIRLRMSEEKVRMMEDEGVFILPPGTDIEEFVKPDQLKDKRNPSKKHVKDAGIKLEGTYKYAMIYMVYRKLDLGGDNKEEAITFYGGQETIIGIIKNPLWSGKRPILSKPVERLQGSFFGQSKIEPVKFQQWQLVDFWNMGMDSAMYSLLPIFKADPLSNPNWASMTMGLAAVWPIAPGSLDTITIPPLWKDSLQLCDGIKRQIWESLDVNEMMMGKTPQGRKNNNMMGQMQQEAQTNISDHASRYEDVILNPLMEMLFEFDQQYRTKELMIERRGEIGVKAALEIIPPPQWGEKYFFRWTGTEFMQNMQRQQQQIAFMNVLKGVPPQQLNGREIDVTPILESCTDNLFGPEVGPRILIDKRNMYAIPPGLEDEMMFNGHPVTVHEADNDAEHMQAHMTAANVNGDPLGLYQQHMMAHMQQMQKKREMQQPPQQGLPGAPGGAGPGVAGTPRPGAMPAPGGPRMAQNPPGAVGADQMPGVPGRG